MALFWKRKDSPAEFVTAPPPEEEADEKARRAVEDASWRGPEKAKGEAEPAGEPEAKRETAAAPRGLFGRVRAALSDRIQKTKESVVGQIREAIKAAGKVDENLIERIEEILIQADIGAETTMRIVEEMREFEARGASTDELLKSFKKQLLEILGHGERSLSADSRKPYVIMVVGVNGVGKTTTIGKLAWEFAKSAGKKTMLVAGDTFRAAAIEQLKIWADRTSSEFVSREMGSDPAAIAFDAVERAVKSGHDVVIIDTAGRLHTKTNLMEELKKIVRVIDKQMPGAPHEVLLVLDATTGQNAISQAKVFTEEIGVTGLVMTKLDGTAKGGVLIGIRNLFDVPVLKIGVGEAVEDLRDFDAPEFVDALFAE